MVSNLENNALYHQYMKEKSLLETYGHVSSLTYEEWLETKKTNKTMESVIDKAIQWFKNISEATKEITSGNASHKCPSIRGMANRSAEYLEKHKKYYSQIKWQTGEPPTNGVFLVVYKGYVCFFERKREFWIFHGKIISDKDTTAWCKLSDIEPYKEEKK